jgi:hypothetical protein
MCWGESSMITLLMLLVVFGAEIGWLGGEVAATPK